MRVLWSITRSEYPSESQKGRWAGKRDEKLETRKNPPRQRQVRSLTLALKTTLTGLLAQS